MGLAVFYMTCIMCVRVCGCVCARLYIRSSALATYSLLPCQKHNLLDTCLVYVIWMQWGAGSRMLQNPGLGHHLLDGNRIVAGAIEELEDRLDSWQLGVDAAFWFSGGCLGVDMTLDIRCYGSWPGI